LVRCCPPHTGTRLHTAHCTMASLHPRCHHIAQQDTTSAQSQATPFQPSLPKRPQALSYSQGKRSIAHATHLHTTSAVCAPWTNHLRRSLGRVDSHRVVPSSNCSWLSRPFGTEHGVVATGPSLVRCRARRTEKPRCARSVACTRTQFTWRRHRRLTKLIEPQPEHHNPCLRHVQDPVHHISRSNVHRGEPSPVAHPNRPAGHGSATPPTQYELPGHSSALVRVDAVPPVVSSPGSAISGVSDPWGQYTLVFPQAIAVAVTDIGGQ
jgi:hypothetical protein